MEELAMQKVRLPMRSDYPRKIPVAHGAKTIDVS